MAKVRDTETVPNLGLQTLTEFFASPEMAAPYETAADEDDTFAELDDCTNAVWARHLRAALSEINEVFACRKSVPITDKIAANTAAIGAAVIDHWRAGDDQIQALVTTDFPVGTQPTGLLNLNGSDADALSAAVVVDHVTPSSVRLNWGVATVQGGSGGTATFLGLVNSGIRNYWLDTTGLATGDNDLAFFMTVRIPAWNQANNGVVLASYRLFDSAAETGGTDRMGWEFGLGQMVDGALHTAGAVPTGSEQDRVLYLRYIDDVGSEQEVVVTAAASPTAPQLSLQPGPEWFVGFNRYEGATFDFVEFYINGRKVSSTQVPKWDVSGSNPDLRLNIGSRENSLKFTGGPMRNVFWWDDQGDGLDEALVLELYRKSTGYLLQVP